MGGRMTKRKGQVYTALAGTTAFILLLNLFLIAAPGPIQQYTGINTTALQDSTNVSATVNANQTSETNVVNQAGDLVSIYTNFSSENLLLNAIATLYTVILLVALIDLIWLG